jgi:hypothetical protein
VSDQNEATPQETSTQIALREKHDVIRSGIGAGGLPMAIVPTTFLEAQSMAGALAASDLVPKAYRDRPANVLLAMMSGAELGLAPLAALRAFHVIEGSPKLGARALAALVNRSGLAEYFEPVEVTPQKATWRTKKKGRPEMTRTWTIEMAENAGLSKKDNWRNYPHRMLSARASKDLADDVYPELTMGLSIVEEEETPIGDQVFTAPPPPPVPSEKPKRAAAKKSDSKSDAIDAEFTETKSDSPVSSTSSAPASSSTSSASSAGSRPTVASNPPPHGGATIGEPPERPTMGAPDPGAADALAKARAARVAEEERARSEAAAARLLDAAANQVDDGFGEDDDTNARPHSPPGPDATLSVEENFKKFERELAACTKETIGGADIKKWVPWSKKDGAGAAYGQMMRDAFTRRKGDLGV